MASRDELIQELARASEWSAKHQAEIARLRGEVERLQDRLGAADRIKEDLESEVETYRHEAESGCLKEFRGLRAQLADALRERDEWRVANSRLRLSNSDLREYIGELKGERDEARDLYVETEEKFAREVGVNDALRVKVEELTKERDVAREQLEIVEFQMSKDFSKGWSLAQENESLREVIRRGMSYTDERIDAAVEEVKRD